MWWWIPIALASETPVEGWEVGAGARNSIYEEQLAEGAHLIVRRRQGPWSLALRGYARVAEARYSTLQETLVEIAQPGSGFAHPIDVDQQTLALIGGWHPWALGGRGGAPVLYAGIEGRRQGRYWLSDSGDGLVFDGPESSLRAGPVVGAGLEVEVGPVVSRLVVSDRMLIAPPLTYEIDTEPEGLTLHHAPTVSLDVLVRLGGQP